MEKIEPEYQNALDYLYSFVDYSLTRNFRYSADKFDLGRMRKFMNELGNPQCQYPIFHIAGTKGKGSTAALIAGALQIAGYKTGFYSSPHLQDYCERIQINRQPILHSELVGLLDEIKPIIASIDQLTTFEITTALAFLYFHRMHVTCAVFEVGLGGRLDATNIVDPFITVITSLSMDHMNVLGNTLSLIAVEKAGIIKPNRPVILAPQKEEAENVIQRIANEKNAPLIQVGKDILFAPGSHNLERQSLMVWTSLEQGQVDDYVESSGRVDWEPLRLSIKLLGYHQIENAATAYAALKIARDNGFSISDEDIVSGFRNVTWPGRFEIIQKKPFVILDSAHNRDSALKLRMAIDDYLPGIPIILVFGASEDKDIKGMFSELLPRVRSVVATQSVHPRACAPQKLVELAHQFGKPARIVLPLSNAIAYAQELADGESAVLITGSIFVAAAARDELISN